MLSAKLLSSPVFEEPQIIKDLRAKFENCAEKALKNKTTKKVHSGTYIMYTEKSTTNLVLVRKLEKCADNGKGGEKFWSEWMAYEYHGFDKTQDEDTLLTDYWFETKADLVDYVKHDLPARK